MSTGKLVGPGSSAKPLAPRKRVIKLETGTPHEGGGLTGQYQKSIPHNCVDRAFNYAETGKEGDKRHIENIFRCLACLQRHILSKEAQWVHGVVCV